MRGGAEHAETAGAADGCNDVAAMAEGQQRKYDAQHVADRRFHGCAHSLRQLLVLLVFGFGCRRLAYRRCACQAAFLLAPFRAAKYATRNGGFRSCALVPRVECW